MAEVNETTVESALAELRKMFPKKNVYLQRSDYFRLSASGRDDQKMPKVILTITEIEYKYGPPLVIETYTLSEAMTQVRAWREQQEAKR